MLIEKDACNDSALFEIYKSAYMQPSQDDDGHVKLVVDGIHLSARALPDRPYFALSTVFGVKSEAARLQCLELCNRLNDHMIMIRFCVPEAADEQCIYVDHFTVTEGGITGEEIVAVTHRFAKVIRDGFSKYDTDDIIN